MAFDKFKAKPLQRFTSSLWNSLMDALSEIYSKLEAIIADAVKWSDLTELKSDIVPKEDAQRNLGSSEKKWKKIFAAGGEFSESLTVQGKAVIKDGDPVSVSDLGTAARDKIRDAIDLSTKTANIETNTSHIPTISSRVEGIRSKVVSFRQDSAGNLGAVIADVEAAARDKVRDAVDSSVKVASIETYASNIPTINSRVESINSKITSIRQDSAGNIGSVVADVEAAAAEKIRSAVDSSTKISSIEAQSQRLTAIETYAKDSRDSLVKLSFDQENNLKAAVVKPLDSSGRVMVDASTVIEALFAPAYAAGSITAEDNTNGFSITLDKGGRPYVNIYFSTTGSSEIIIEASVDGSTWRTLEAISDTTGPRLRMYSGIAYRYIKARTPTTGVGVEFEIVASR